MPAHRSRAELAVDARNRSIYTASASFSMASGIATMNAAVESISGGDVTPGQSVALDMGLDNVVRRVFTGEVEEEGAEYWPEGVEFPAVGPLHRARKKTNHIDLDWPGAVGDPDLPTPPSYAYYAIGATDTEHVAALLELAGITEYDLEGSEEVIGDINPVILPTGGSPWALIQEIDRRTWYRTFDGPDGTIVRRPFSILPSAGAAMTLTEGVDLHDGRRIRSRSGMIANVHIIGTSYIGADDWPIVIEYATDNPATNEYGVNDVLEYQSELFETAEQAETWAATAMGEYGILQVRYRFTLVKGFSDLRAGMTVAIVSGRYGLTSTSRFLVESVRHYTDGTEYLTSIELRGAAEPNATSANQKPVPVVVQSIHRETIDGDTVDTVGLDASGSYDPDGAAIGSFAWDGDPVVPTPIGDGQRATVTYTGGVDAQTPDPPTVTLTVTDLMGAVAARTFPIEESAATPIQTRDLWAAVSSELLYTPDGGETWDTFAVAAVGCVREVSGYQLAWTAAGALYKVVPGEAPALLTPTNVTCAWVSYQVGDVFSGVAYAGGSDGKVWRSVDEGESWVERGALPDALTTISESPYAEGQLQATAGDKTYESFDAGAVWTMRHEYGDETMTAADFAAGFGKGLIGFQGADTAESHIQERDGSPVVTFPAGHEDAQVRAITISGSEQTFWALSTEAAGDGESWQGDLISGGELVEKSYDAIHGEPWDMIRDPKIEGLIYFVQNTRVGKTLTGFADTLTVLLLSGAQLGRKLGIGPLRAFSPPVVVPVSGNLVWVGGPNGGRGIAPDLWVYRLTDDGFERFAHPMSGFSGTATQNIALVTTTSGNLITYGHIVRSPSHTTNAYISTDGGETWDALAVQQVCEVRPGPGGVVYASRQSNVANEFGGYSLHRSDDNGASWAQVDTIGGSGIIASKYNALWVSPNDPLDILCKGYWNTGSSANQADNPRALDFHRSTDGGATWAHLLTDPDDQGNIGNGRWVALSPDGAHILWYRQESSPSAILRADYPGGGAAAPATTARNSANPYPSVVHGGNIYMYGFMGALVSTDQGATWTVEADGLNTPIADTQHDMLSFVPGDAMNDWYALPFSPTNFVALVTRAAGSASGAAWSDLTATLLADFPDEMYYAFREAAVRLP